jgi:hypothetical protein
MITSLQLKTASLQLDNINLHTSIISLQRTHINEVK